jgi:hypothetical protein
MNTFAENIYEYAARTREGEMVGLGELNKTQQGEVMRQVGDSKNVSPEGLAHAMESYVTALQHQVEVAKAFYLGRLQQGVEGLASLPDDVQTQIDQLIWESSGGEPIDPTLVDAQNLIAGAVMHSVEMRMGMLEE